MAISTLDEGVYVDVNESFTSSLGFARDEIIGRTPLELELYANPEDRKKFIAGLREFGIIRNYEIQVRTRNGKLRDGLFYADTIRLHGRACILSVMTDITEVKRTETERLKMEIQLRNTQKFESLGLLAGGIAHDFNNLLMAVLGNAEAALDILPEDDPARAYLNSIERAGQRAADLTRQMLAYSGRDHFEAKALDVSQLVTEMTGLMEIGLSKKAGLKLLLTENLPSVIADAGQIQQVIMNIVSNASEALDETGGLITVSTGYTRMEDEEINKAVFHEDAHSGLYVYIEVSDTGCGIAPDGIAQMFDPFYSTKCTGRGLGMAVVQGIVQGHKGIISVQSKTGQGATIRVSLPATSADPQRFMAANAPVPTQKWQGSGKILVVDDEEDIRSLAQMALERFGFSVLLANDGVHAIDLFREHRNEIALVLLDMTMPRMDGRETFLALRELRPDVPVVVASGYSEHDIARRFSDISFQGVLTKPYRRSQLLERVRKALAGRQLPRD
jgi:PAS domain S-box-containing protein